MTAPKIRPCPNCLDGGDPVVMTYEHGWKHVECLDCDLMGAGEGSKLAAIKSWNAFVLPASPDSAPDVAVLNQIGGA